MSDQRTAEQVFSVVKGRVFREGVTARVEVRAYEIAKLLNLSLSVLRNVRSDPAELAVAKLLDGTP